MTSSEQLFRYKYDFHRNSCITCTSLSNALPLKRGIQKKPKLRREKRKPKNMSNSIDNTTISFNN